MTWTMYESCLTNPTCSQSLLLLHSNKTIEVKFLDVWAVKSTYGRFSLSSKCMVWSELGWIFRCRYGRKLSYTKAAWEMHAHWTSQGSAISLVRDGSLGQPVRLTKLRIICPDIVYTACLGSISHQKMISNWHLKNTFPPTQFYKSVFDRVLSYIWRLFNKGVKVIVFKMLLYILIYSNEALGAIFRVK